MSKNYSPPDYAEYRFSLKQGMLVCAEGAAVVAMIGYFFYRSWLACVFLIPVFGFWVREKKREEAKKRRQELSMQFNDLVLASGTWSFSTAGTVRFVGRYGICCGDWKIMWFWNSFCTTLG